LPETGELSRVEREYVSTPVEEEDEIPVSVSEAVPVSLSVSTGRGGLGQ